MIHNIIHLASGLIGIAAAATSLQNSRMFLIIFGLVYGLVTIIGFMQGTTILGLFSINDADNYLHLAISAACLIVGFVGKQSIPNTTIMA